MRQDEAKGSEVSSPGLLRESHPVEGNHHRSPQADVVLQGHFGARHLPPARLAAELPAQLCTLGQA